MAEFICKICGKVYNQNSNLRRHVRLQHEGPTSSAASPTSSSLKCSTCNLEFKSYNQFQAHRHLIYHNDKNIYCESCKQNIKKELWHYHLRTNFHKSNNARQMENNIKTLNSSFKNRIETYIFENHKEDNLIPETFFNEIEGNVISQLNGVIQKHVNIKFNCELFCQYALLKDENELCTLDMKSHQTKMIILNAFSTKHEIAQLFTNQCDSIIHKMSEFQERDSGWTLIAICHLEININEYKSIKGSQYIDLPTSIKEKQACINVKNNDEYCFKWAVIAALGPVPRDQTPKRCTSYKINNIEDDIIVLENNITINFSNLTFPLCINKIKEFEKNNQKISINVFGLENDHIVGPYYFTQSEKPTHINLLLLEDGERFHYVWIKNISR